MSASHEYVFNTYIVAIVTIAPNVGSIQLFDVYNPVGRDKKNQLASQKELDD